MAIEWKKAEPGNMPEDFLKHERVKHFKCAPAILRTPYVLVIRKLRERPDCCCRILLKEDGRGWVWSCGDGCSEILYWAVYNVPDGWEPVKPDQNA